MNDQAIDKKTLRSVFWRSFALQGAFNYERMQNLGYAYAMIPVLRKLYQTEQARAQGLQRHLTFFNTTPAVSPAIMGISAAMEEQNAKDPKNFDTSSINAVKAALMAPVAGIGDSLFWGTLRVIAAGIGISLASQGNVLGPILFMVLYNVPHLLTRYYGLRLGYRFGNEALEKMSASGAMERVMSIANIIGMMVVGGMVATLLSITTTVTFSLEESSVEIQEILDQILPSMLPLAAVMIIFLLIRRKVSVTRITLATLASGILLHALHIL
ncbi:PTS system mannose/fructose/sorbose family transporter subunit IID [Brachybacterium sacelli]|uniref:PTS system mannose-specific IID component n=1 Tax=Brachybacterium sacelli TaxID=173364 RepID=A0ABS4WZ35_9MICO|nr:PTS system mannose/fructose/sorbose family transporter subunit IID [Brachybacterium sacelli]MBP2381472.1 PTS system mannose-specific IID component [Brachybacterium sacelli]